MTSFSNGTYQRIFSNDTQLAIAAINASATKLFGDTLIGKLGNDVRYGSIWSDYLRGTIRGDKMYGSAGNDILDGNRGDDILEGGGGKDRLFGHLGNDKLHGGSGDDTLRGSSDNDTLVGGDDNDYLVGGYGSDVMTGNGGEDKFVYEGYINLLPGEFDIIKDFEVSKDKLVLKGWDDFDADQLFSDAVSQGLITNTENGALLNPGIGGQLLFENVDISALSGSDFILA